MASLLSGRRPLALALALGVSLSVYRQYNHGASLNSGLALGQSYYYGGAMIRKLIDAEKAHKLGVYAATLPPTTRRILGLYDSFPDPAILHTQVFGLQFPNPIGLAAGFDKHAEAMSGLLDMGFGFVEIGSVTPQPQPGNPQPRVFRLEEDKAIINRYGFNSEGIVGVLPRLKQWSEMREKNKNDKIGQQQFKNRRGPGIVGVNLGKNKTSTDAEADYIQGLNQLSQYGDYVVVNVSSPNTPGLRDLQGKQELHKLLYAVKAARDKQSVQKPLLVKIAPDLTDLDKRQIAEVLLEVGVDGVIISNTTIARSESLRSPNKTETGTTHFILGIHPTWGLSGAPLFEPSTNVLKEMYQLTEGRIPIIGVGGVGNAQQAYQKIKAGASLVQLYTSFAYEGPVLVGKIRKELAALVEQDGYKSIQEAVGVDARNDLKKLQPVTVKVPAERAQQKKSGWFS